MGYDGDVGYSVSLTSRSVWRVFQNTTAPLATLDRGGSGIDTSEILQNLGLALPRVVAWGIGRTSTMAFTEREWEGISGNVLCPM